MFVEAADADKPDTLPGQMMLPIFDDLLAGLDVSSLQQADKFTLISEPKKRRAAKSGIITEAAELDAEQFGQQSAARGEPSNANPFKPTCGILWHAFDRGWQKEFCKPQPVDVISDITKHDVHVEKNYKIRIDKQTDTF
jgi:hypothetical protein